ncbi:unannotated protein [freshwater metagenome]|uniref:Unannotated protein n=1 Tax=freshwater metagenome TaxID=449393 RepID=A0A6J7H5K4_9ZZZZ|nr:hypothetical protein [Actinomycetota bacterium]
MKRIKVTVRDYKRGQPWVVEAEHEEVVEVPDGVPFWEAADRRWPRERHSVEPLVGEPVV